jgi:hypothetical protein
MVAWLPEQRVIETRNWLDVIHLYWQLSASLPAVIATTEPGQTGHIVLPFLRGVRDSTVYWEAEFGIYH